LTFQLSVPGRDKPLVRCYSLSDSPHRSDYYRVTIKKERAPADRPDLPCGAGSSYVTYIVKEGDILDVKAPSGHFYLDMAKSHPVVLIAGGVGVTPMLSMAQAVAASGSKRELWFFYGVRNSKEHIHKQELEKLAAENENIKRHQKPVIGCDRLQPGTNGNAPAEEEPCQSIGSAKDRINQPQAAFDARIFLCLFLFFGIQRCHKIISPSHLPTGQ
jgi:ferredoxin-NADP reductase